MRFVGQDPKLCKTTPRELLLFINLCNKAGSLITVGVLDNNMMVSADLKDLALPRNQIAWRSSAPFWAEREGNKSEFYPT